MFKLLVLMACARCACGAEPLEPDPMLTALVRGGAAQAAVCADAAGCAGALWARHWLLTRASCLARSGRHLHRAPVLLHRPPQDCRAFLTGERDFDALEALARFVHPAYTAPASDDFAPVLPPEFAPVLPPEFAPVLPPEFAPVLPPPPEPAPPRWDPLDAALVLLVAPAPVPPADNYSATYALLPELSSWVRYVPASVPWSLEHAPPPSPARLDPGRVPLLNSPLRVLAATVLLPVAALLAGFFLLLRVPEHADTEQEKLLTAVDAPDCLTPEPNESVWLPVPRGVAHV